MPLRCARFVIHTIENRSMLSGRLRPAIRKSRNMSSMSKVLETLTDELQGPSAKDFRTLAPRPSRAELLAEGVAMRKKCPRGSHAAWSAPGDRPDPVRLIEEANAGRIPELIPLRHGRMLPSPFTFYRGTALNMAVDLAGTPTTGFRVQACGDAHLGNFRCFATPERRVIFDIHDLDETLPAPWEWDVKRLAASFVLACRSNGFSDKPSRDAVLTCVRSYREAMGWFSTMRALDVWYARFEAKKLIADIDDAEIRARTRKLWTRRRMSASSKTFSPSWPTGRAKRRPSKTTRHSSTTTWSVGRTSSTRESRKSFPTTANHCRTTDVSSWTGMPSRTRRSR